MVTDYPPSRLARAYHEAGHCVGAIDCGQPIRSATIRETPGEHAGEVAFYKRATPSVTICVCLCGPIAEHRFRFGGAPFIFCDYTWRFDARAVLDALASENGGRPMANPTDSAVYKSALASAETIVRNRWSAITAIARALNTQTTLTGATCVALTTEAANDRRQFGETNGNVYETQRRDVAPA